MTLKEPNAGRGRMTIDEAVRHFRATAQYARVIEDSFLDRDVERAARRFAASAEFAAVLSMLGDAIKGAVVLDLGAGTGISSYAFLQAGARKVIALEPDASDEVGQGAIRRLGLGDRVDVVTAFGESMPIESESVDIVYCRQVLHHTSDLALTLRECARVLRPGGYFLGTREHVVNDAKQLAAFLRKHPMHQLAGGENAYTLSEYVSAVEGAPLTVKAVLGPWDSIINAFPHARSDADLAQLPAKLLRERLGRVGAVIARLPLVTPLLWRIIRIERPGRMYSFFAQKQRAA